MDEDSIAEKADNFPFNNRHEDETARTNSSLEFKTNVVSNSESLKQPTTMNNSSTYNRPVYKTVRQCHPVASLQMKLNSRYISKISNSPRKLQDQSIRMRPYFVPERSRTKSESAETKTDSYDAQIAVTEELFADQCDTMMDTSCDNATLTNTGLGNTPSLVKVVKNCSLKKSKSLEDIRAKVVDGSCPSHEMEFVSSRIQKLKVQD